MKVTSVFIKYLNYACKITWIEFLITLCLVKNSIQISKRKHSVTSRFIWEAIYKTTRARVSPGYPNTRKQCMKTLALRARVFIHCQFSCLDIPVRHSLSLFIYYVKTSSWLTFLLSKFLDMMSLDEFFEQKRMTPFSVTSTEKKLIELRWGF